MVKEQLILNRGNSEITNNFMRYHFDRQVEFKNKNVSLQFLSIPFSWYNITNENENTKVSYRINGVSYPVEIPEGYYTPEQLLEYFEFVWTNAGHYLEDASGKKIFYLSWEINVSYYAYTLVSTNLPTALPGGWSDPSGMIDGNGYAWQLEITDPGFGKILGFSPGIYPNNPLSPGTLPVSYSGGAYAFNSNIIPQVDFSTTINIGANIINNQLQQTNHLASFIPQNTSFGSYIVQRPNFAVEQVVTDGSYSDLVINFIDQEDRPLRIRDTDITVVLVISDQ